MASEINIEKKFENAQMERNEVECLVNFKEGTPKKGEIIELIAKALTVNKELVVINQMLQQFGMKQVRVVACVYKNKDAMKRVLRLKDEPKPVEKKEEKPAEEKPKEEAPKEEAKPEEKKEAPKEEKKEEPKKEEPKAEEKKEEKKEEVKEEKKEEKPAEKKEEKAEEKKE